MISITLDKPEYAPGDAVRAAISLILNKPKRARGLYAELSCIERRRVTEYRVKDKYDYDREKELGGFKETHMASHEAEQSRILFRKELRVAGEGEFKSGAYEASFTLPSDARPTSHEFGHDNAIHIWKLRAKLDIPFAVDENAEKEVFVGGL